MIYKAHSAKQCTLFVFYFIFFPHRFYLDPDSSPVLCLFQAVFQKKIAFIVVEKDCRLILESDQ